VVRKGGEKDSKRKFAYWGNVGRGADLNSRKEGLHNGAKPSHMESEKVVAATDASGSPLGNLRNKSSGGKYLVAEGGIRKGGEGENFTRTRGRSNASTVNKGERKKRNDAYEGETGSCTGGSAEKKGECGYSIQEIRARGYGSWNARVNLWGESCKNEEGFPKVRK